MAQLSYNIYTVTSEDPDHSAKELSLASSSLDSSESKGWVSQRFCIYPQELILQFPTPVRLKQLQILLHQNKIPNKVELYSYLPQLNTSSASKSSKSTNTNKYKRLGHFSLNNNERTNFQARELKTVYVDVFCQFLKFVFHKCHLNKSNIFNQTAVVAVTCTGEFLPAAPAQFGDQVTQGLNVMSKDMRVDPQNPQDMDPYLKEKYIALMEAKKKAIEMEDYDGAKRVKLEVDRIIYAINQISQIDLQKKLAIENEDYDAAKLFKLEAQRIREEAIGIKKASPKPNKKRSPQKKEIEQKEEGDFERADDEEDEEEGDGERCCIFLSFSYLNLDKEEE
jgi:centrosomal protein CEP104